MAEASYEVGYGKPPKHSQFQKGQSGFQGRKHNAKKSAADHFDATLAECITVVEGGKTIKLTRLEVFIRQLVARAINGERQASKLLLDQLKRDHERPADEGLGSADAFLMEELVRMLDARGEEP